MTTRYTNLINLIDKYQPQSILEIGTWNGINAGKMIKQALKYHNKVTYWGFDLFENFKGLAKKEFCPKTPAKYKEVLARLSAIENANVQLIWGNTKETLTSTVNPPTFDMIFLDGGHSVETIESDWYNVQRYAHEQTFFVLDDYYYDPKLSERFGCRQLTQKVWNDSFGKIEMKWLTPVDKIDKIGDIAMVLITQVPA